MPKTNSPIAVFDGHCDSLILREVRDDPIDFADCDPTYQADSSRLRKGGVAAMFVMVGDSDLRQSLRLIDGVRRIEANHPDAFAVCGTAAEVRKARRTGRIALVMSIESQTMFEEDPAPLRLWHRLGVRMMSLTHGEGRSRASRIALQYTGSHVGWLAADERAVLYRQSKGLTPFAREALREMGRLNIIADLAHVNDRAFFEALECATGPVAVTHGNTYALCPHTRNSTDEMMRALAARGGVLGVCPYKRFVDVESPSCARLADHVLHALEIMGENHVGFGSDLDGIPLNEEGVIPDAAAVPMLWSELRRRGVSAKVIRKVAFDNFLRLLS